MNVPTLDLKAQYATLRDEVHEAIIEVLESQRFILGPKVTELEAEIARYCEVPHAVGVSSGTDALLIALMAEEIGPDDEVITSSYSFFASAGSIHRLGATPVFVDIDPATFNLDPAALQAALTERTRAILPVHLFGQMADMDPVLELARRRDLIVVEDAAQAIGCRYGGRPAGSLGHYGCFSFFPSKNLGAYGDGGIVTATDDARAERLEILRGHGARPKYFHKVVGGNFRLDAIQAAVLLVKLRYLDRWHEARRGHVRTYRRLFRDRGLDLSESVGPRPSPAELEAARGVLLPVEAPGRTHLYNQLVVRASRRDGLQAHLQRQGVGTAIYYPRPLHLQECFASLGYGDGDFPFAEQAARTSLALPLYPELTEEQIRHVVAAVEGFYA